MKTFRLIAASLLAQIAAIPTALAVTLPVWEDTFGTTTKVKEVIKTAVTPAGGKSGSLPISKTRTAFVRFDVGGSGILPASVIDARLIIYLPLASKPGDIDVFAVTQDWEEKFTGAPRPQPTIAPLPLATIPAASVLAKQFIIVNVTDTVKAWLAAPANDFGLALVSKDGIASVVLGAKEGAATGYPAVLEIETNAAASVFQNGNVASGIINGAAIAPGSIGSTQISGGIGLWNRNGSSFFYNAGNVGIGTTSPGAPLDIDIGPANFQIRNDGGVVPGINITGGGNPGILRLRNSLEIHPNDAGTASGSLDVRNLNGTATVRLDGGNGRIGIGTPDPAASLDINTGVGSVQIRNDGNLVPGINVSGGGLPGIMRFRNALEIWPNDAGTAGGYIDLRDTTGTARIALNGADGTANFGSTTRQMLNLFNTGYGIGVQNNTLYHRSDGGFIWYRNGTHNNNEGNSGGGTQLMRVDSAGNLSTGGGMVANGNVSTTGTLTATGNISTSGTLTATGNLTANNLPGVEFFTSANTLSCPAGVTTPIAQVTVSVPAAGFVILTTSIDIGTAATDYFFRLRDTTAGGSTVLTSTLPKGTQQNATLTFVVQVFGAGTKNFDAVIIPTGNSATVGDRNLNAVYVPVRY